MKAGNTGMRSWRYRSDLESRMAEAAEAELERDESRCKRTHYVTAEGGRFRARCRREKRHGGRCVDARGRVW